VLSKNTQFGLATNNQQSTINNQQSTNNLQTKQQTIKKIKTNKQQNNDLQQIWLNKIQSINWFGCTTAPFQYLRRTRPTK